MRLVMIYEYEAPLSIGITIFTDFGVIDIEYEI
jgi:hypothetical protein